MPNELKDTNPHDKPARRSALLFAIKATLLQIDRAAQNIRRNETVRFPVNHQPTNAVIIAESRTRLWSEGTEADKNLALGKVHNLRLALQRLHGAEIPAGSIFSFWAQIGRASRWGGYVAGRELREGCIIPSVGGGLCQLSNALYDAALSAGFEIIERHAHTQIIPGSFAELDRDATVFWNYVDLRFRSPSPFRIEATMDANLLTVRLRSSAGQSLPHYRKKITVATASATLQSCVTCDEQGCFRYVERRETDLTRAAYLLDEYYPEFNDYIRDVRREQDLLAVPLDGKKFRKGNYAWSTENFQHVRQSRIVTLLRAYQSRKLASQGPARQQALLAHSARLARSYSGLLTYDITHVTVSQNLLPFLWRDRYLGGRTFDVLMTALPLARLHERLDAAFALHPESKTLADFRADESLVDAESEALQCARRIITPHSEIAALYENKVVRLDWAMPSKARTLQPKRVATYAAKILFPASTIGRKGAYELRAAIEGLNVRLITMGAELEGPDFWQGRATEHRASAEDWLEGIDAVVLPAFVEHKPRRLLEAVARGTPVIASQACGLEDTKGVINVPVGDIDRLRAEITRLPVLQRQA